jgi:hypothetical protein
MLPLPCPVIVPSNNLTHKDSPPTRLRNGCREVLDSFSLGACLRRQFWIAHEGPAQFMVLLNSWKRKS